MDCPKCGLVNPKDALYCDCGYDFSNGAISEDADRALAPGARRGPGAKAFLAASPTAYSIWILSIGLYCLSMALPPVQYPGTSGGFGDAFGLGYLILGPLGLVFMQLGAIGWLANPLFLFSAATLPKKAGPSFFIALTLALALAVLAVPMLRAYPVLKDEAGHREPASALPGFGYCVWLASMLAMLASGMVRARRRNRPPGLAKD
jgi:hypothetical protein